MLVEQTRSEAATIQSSNKLNQKFTTPINSTSVITNVSCSKRSLCHLLWTWLYFSIPRIHLTTIRICKWTSRCGSLLFANQSYYYYQCLLLMLCRLKDRYLLITTPPIWNCMIPMLLRKGGREGGRVVMRWHNQLWSWPSHPQHYYHLPLGQSNM